MDRDHAVRPRKSPRQRRSRATVERILAAAARVFDERGYDATTTNEVAARAEVSVGSLYQYFPNKDALLLALAEHHVAEASVALRALLSDLASREPDAEDLVRQLLGLALAANDTRGLHAVIYQQAPRTPELQQQLDDLADITSDEVARHLHRLGTGGADAWRRARLLVTACDAAVHEIVGRYPPGASRDEAVEDLAGVVLQGIAPRGSSSST